MSARHPVDKEPEILKIARRMRSARLIKVGLKGGLKAAESAVSVAMGRKSKQASYEDFVTGLMRQFVRELSELKGGLMKAGQLLSVYGEHFFPAEINDILKTLQADSRVVAFSVMSKRIAAALGRDRFARLKIEPRPLGAASLGQVYKVKVYPVAAGRGQAQTMALKVQYPRLARAIEADLATIKKLTTVLKLLPDSQRYNQVYDEVKTMLYREMDYTRELKAYQKYAQLLADDPILRVPRVYPEFSTKTILAMECIQGRRLDDPVVGSISQERRNQFALGIMRLLYEEIFVWRMVQTDPHIGNFLVQLKEDGYPQDALYLLDFGAVRRFGSYYIGHFRDMARSAIENCPADIIHHGTQLGFLKSTDSLEMQELFVKIALTAVQPFLVEYAGEGKLDGSYGEHEYDWSELMVIHEISKLARNAVFAFKLRPPPREALFIDRKLVGTVTLLKMLRAKLGPRKLALAYLRPQPDALEDLV